MSPRGRWLFAAGMVLSLGCGTLIGTDFDDLEPRDETGGAGGVAGTGGGGTGGTGGGGAGGAGAGGAGNGGAGNGGAGAGNGGAGAGNGGAGAGNGGAGAAGCPSKHGPLMVAIPTPSGGTMCIDSTEVTNGQYAEFLVSAGAAELAAQSPACSWNVSFAPYEDCIKGSAVCAGACNDHPQVCADQCDAVAYCKWAGKRLCGSLAGGALAYGAFADPTQSMWMNACSAGLTLSAPANKYPYGNTFDPTACDATPASGCITDKTCTSTPVASHPACVTSGAYAGVYDLSGSAWEWEDACLPGVNGAGPCRVRGGSFQDGSEKLACGVDQSLPMFNAYSNIGFRCCSP